jgi:hypothetical protein
MFQRHNTRAASRKPNESVLLEEPSAEGREIIEPTLGGEPMSREGWEGVKNDPSPETGGTENSFPVEHLDQPSPPSCSFLRSGPASRTASRNGIPRDIPSRTGAPHNVSAGYRKMQSSSAPAARLSNALRQHPPRYAVPNRSTS